MNDFFSIKRSKNIDRISYRMSYSKKEYFEKLTPKRDKPFSVGLLFWRRSKVKNNKKIKNKAYFKNVRSRTQFTVTILELVLNV